MCGIVGYSGPKNPKDVILTGLKKLEYRGYDSAGIAILHNGHFERTRAEGKLVNLENKLADVRFSGHLGIGHTRWATHGVPSERNAHPHQVGGVSLVHNGIIENYLEIRDELLKNNANITSDTDSELVAHLIELQLKKDKDLFKAVLNVLPQLKGAFSILAVWDQQPDTLVAFKDGPPLIVGLGEKEAFVVSDVQAALVHTNRFVYLEDREVVLIKASEVSFFSEHGKAINKPVVQINWNAEQSEKMGFSHFMLKEIYEQPQALSAALLQHLSEDKKQVELKRVGFGVSPIDVDKLDLVTDQKKSKEILTQIDRIVIVACGTSYYAGLVAKYAIEKLAKIPVEVDVASEFRYRSPILNSRTLVLSISQSGETADTLAAIRLAKESSAITLSLCNVKNSTIDREAFGHLYMMAGPEVGVASTKAFTSSIMILNLFALSLAKYKGLLSATDESLAISSFLKIPNQVEVMLGFDKYFLEAAQELKSYKGFLYMGRGVSYPIALEGALKLKELAYVHAEGYAAGEMKHGPLALMDEKMAVIMLAPDDDLFEKTVSNLEEAKARGGQILSIGSDHKDRLKRVSKRFLAVPSTYWLCNPILLAVPMQLMAFHLAQSLGHDVDQPRNLAKSVTVE